jgi:hypothetical protein
MHVRFAQAKVNTTEIPNCHEQGSVLMSFEIYHTNENEQCKFSYMN